MNGVINNLKIRRSEEEIYAEYHHRNQVRKYTNEPYINHPKNVVKIVSEVIHTETMIKAAWLHDIVEDTNITLADIDSIFGLDVAMIVEELTDISKPSDGNRIVRKLIDRVHTSNASPAAKTIKLADLIDNSKSIIQYDTKFAMVYMAEKKLLLEVLQDGNEELYDQCLAIVNNYYES